MSPRVFFSALAQETNVFSALPTGMESFTGRFEVPGYIARSAPPFPESLLAGLQRLQEQGAIHLTVGPVAGAQPSGIVTARAFEALRDAILAQVDATLPLDIVALHLHGAMIAEGEPDCEGDLLTRIRDKVGDRTLIGALLDPHAHLSTRMLESADILIAYKEYPHTDFRERAAELIDLLLRAHRGSIKPCAALWDAGVIGVFHTHRAEVRALVDRMQSWERGGEALSVSLIHGFPWGDTQDFGTRALVISDDDLPKAQRLAAALATAAQAVAIESPIATTPLETALCQLPAARPAEGPVVWADTADNPGGGAAGDSTYVLAALHERGFEGACLGPLWDPGVVDIAFNLGVGGSSQIRLGGKTGVHSGAPLDLHAQVIALDAEAFQTFAGERFRLGRSAALRCAGIDVVVTSVREQARGTDLFTRLGIPLTEKRLVVVKSSQHFHDAYASIASKIVYVDCAGSLQSDLTAFRYQNLVRPRWPIDASPVAPWSVTTRCRNVI